jgi:hypothetical protein
MKKLLLIFFCSCAYDPYPGLVKPKTPETIYISNDPKIDPDPCFTTKIFKIKNYKYIDPEFCNKEVRYGQ